MSTRPGSTGDSATTSLRVPPDPPARASGDGGTTSLRVRPEGTGDRATTSLRVPPDADASRDAEEAPPDAAASGGAQDAHASGNDAGLPRTPDDGPEDPAVNAPGGATDASEGRDGETDEPPAQGAYAPEDRPGAAVTGAEAPAPGRAPDGSEDAHASSNDAGLPRTPDDGPEDPAVNAPGSATDASEGRDGETEVRPPALAGNAPGGGAADADRGHASADANDGAADGLSNEAEAGEGVDQHTAVLRLPEEGERPPVDPRTPAPRRAFPARRAGGNDPEITRVVPAPEDDGDPEITHVVAAPEDDGDPEITRVVAAPEDGPEVTRLAPRPGEDDDPEITRVVPEPGDDAPRGDSATTVLGPERDADEAPRRSPAAMDPSPRPDPEPGADAPRGSPATMDLGPKREPDDAPRGDSATTVLGPKRDAGAEPGPGPGADGAKAAKAAKARNAPPGERPRAAQAHAAEPAPEAVAPPRPAAPPPVPDAQRNPLELLAELTNRPAPPPTPLRTFGRRVKIWTPLVLFLLLLFVVAQSLRPLPEPELELTAAPSFSFGGSVPEAPWPSSGQAALGVEGLGTFGSSGDQQEPVPIASVAKVMTAYLVLREHGMDTESNGAEIPVDQRAEDEAALSEDGESTVEVEEGSVLTQREALQAIMIASANNVARLLARWSAGSEEEFVRQMNEAAEELGMEHTTYTDPSGLSPETVSTAEDQVLLARAAMEDPVFRQIVRMPSYVDSQGVEHSNWNGLVPVNGVIGIKTGTTPRAGGSLLFAAEQEAGGETRLILGAVLSQPPHPSDNSILTGALTAGDALIRFAQDALTDETVFEAGQEIGRVDDGLGGGAPLVVAEDVRVAGWAGLEVALELDGPAEGGVPGSAEAGETVGRLLIGSGDRRTEVPVAVGADLAEPGFTARLTRIT
ncbi:D-alanyl-D-alanine carboxypeptidase [Streptomyces sp. DSM 44917]|uniref:D-alanyl-D-alanine carboxypeptidase n=1 Tax=Streptomyces boetiae TaxID=3075541 RepID=A0ABU2LBU2_9ACTN|nr:D-alanyl-D-alanine carboxypeptidase [Streptomyces sp. DSM 44917]MDT0309050.1 D-alanyl-D-alanine carboxypeptidase [Streptomyces sp. DSM 44917]